MNRLALVALFGLGAAACAPIEPIPATWPVSNDEPAVSKHEVCVGSTVASAGEPPEVLYYRAARLDAKTLAVGYYVVFSEERPWGKNWMTWTVVPALVVDSIYSHALFVGPGLQRAIYGRGDVEGIGVVYRSDSNDDLQIDHAFADDGDHHGVTLAREDIFAVDRDRPVFYTDTWSHQLGARGAHARKDLAWIRCYAGAAIRPLSDDVAHDYHLEARARPAHIERMARR